MAGGGASPSLSSDACAGGPAGEGDGKKEELVVTDLPKELLALVASKLRDSGDALGFAMTCRAFREAQVEAAGRWDRAREEGGLAPEPFLRTYPGALCSSEAQMRWGALQGCPLRRAWRECLGNSSEQVAWRSAGPCSSRG